MKQIAILATLACTMASSVYAEGMIAKLCGRDHQNEVATYTDVTSNPDGYYIRSLRTQLSHGDARIVKAVGDSYYLCTVSAARPDMDQTKALLAMKERAVKYLFVPVDALGPDACPKDGLS